MREIKRSSPEFVMLLLSLLIRIAKFLCNHLNRKLNETVCDKYKVSECNSTLISDQNGIHIKHLTEAKISNHTSIISYLVCSSFCPPVSEPLLSQ